MIYSIRCFLKEFIILDVKVVPNDNFIFGAERVKRGDDLDHVHSCHRIVN